MDPTPPSGNHGPQGAKAATTNPVTNQSQQQNDQQVFGFDLDLGSTVMIAVMLLLGLLQGERTCSHPVLVYLHSELLTVSTAHYSMLTLSVAC
jgi:hypothetical protein